MIVLIAGTGRCGTHTVQELFARGHNTIALHEGRGSVQGGPVRLGDMKAINIYEGRISRRKDVDLNKVRNDIFKERSHLIRNNKDKNIFLVNRMNYRMITYVYERYDNVKIIHLLRNGYNCVKSWYFRPGLYRGIDRNMLDSIKNNTKEISLSTLYYIKGSATKEHINYLNKNNHVNYLLEKPIPKGIERIRWYFLERIEKVCWYWKFVNRYIEDKLEIIPDKDKTKIKIEELDKNTSKKLSEYTKTKDIESFDFENKREKRKHRELWTKENINKFNNICGKYMKEIGYEIRY